MSSFQVGDKVVCVNDSWPGDENDRPFYDNAPKSGEVYTIRDIGPSFLEGTRWAFLDTPKICVRLVEIRNQIDPRLGVEWNFRASRFRPVVERKRKTSIEVFRKLLAPSKERVP